MPDDYLLEINGTPVEEYFLGQVQGLITKGVRRGQIELKVLRSRDKGQQNVFSFCICFKKEETKGLVQFF